MHRYRTTCVAHGDLSCTLQLFSLLRTWAMTLDVTVLHAHTARLRDHPFLQAHLRIRQLLREGRGVRPVLVSCIPRVMEGFLGGLQFA